MSKKGAKSSVDEIRQNLKEMRPKNHPVMEHPVEKCEEYVKMLYINALCMVAQYENEDADNALRFVARIHSGAGLTNEFSENIKSSMEMTVEKFDEFLKQCKENKLESIFFLDGLLTACADGTPNRKQVEFICELADAIGLEKKHISALSDIAVSILEQDSDKYHEACKKIHSDLIINAICYIKEFVTGVLIDSKDLVWFYSKNKSGLDYDKFAKDYYDDESYIIDGKNIIFENINLSLDFGLNVKNCEKAEFYNCDIDWVMSFNDVGEVVYQGCNIDFRNIEQTVDKVFAVHGVNNFTLNNCNISNVKLEFGNGIGIIHIGSDGSAFELNNCKFTNILKEDNRPIIVGAGDKNNHNPMPNRYHPYIPKSFKIAACEFDSCRSTTTGGYFGQLFPNGEPYPHDPSGHKFINCCKM